MTKSFPLLKRYAQLFNRVRLIFRVQDGKPTEAKRLGYFLPGQGRPLRVDIRALTNWSIIELMTQSSSSAEIDIKRSLRRRLAELMVVRFTVVLCASDCRGKYV
jgi:hypothetical protein